MDAIARGFEAVGVAVLVLGGAHALFICTRDSRAGLGEFYPLMRRRFGRALLLGLEVLVAADIIKTVAVDTTLQSVLTLAVLVSVRVILSFSLDVEIDGVVPWRRLAASARVSKEDPSDGASAARPEH